MLPSSPKTSSPGEEKAEFARAIKKTKLSPNPSCVPADVESQSLVSSSSDSHSKKSIGFKADMMRSESGCLRISRGGILAGFKVECFQKCPVVVASLLRHENPPEYEGRLTKERRRRNVVYFANVCQKNSDGSDPATTGA